MFVIVEFFWLFLFLVVYYMTIYVTMLVGLSVNWSVGQSQVWFSLSFTSQLITTAPTCDWCCVYGLVYVNPLPVHGPVVYNVT